MYFGVSTKNFPESTVKDGMTTQQVIIVNAKQPFSESPMIKITYMAGTLKVITLKLPVILEKYMDPAVLTAEDYFKKWALIGNEGGLEAQKIFKNVSYSSSDTQRPTDDRRNFAALNYSNVKNADPNPNNFVWCSAFCIRATVVALAALCAWNRTPTMSITASLCVQLTNGFRRFWPRISLLYQL